MIRHRAFEILSKKIGIGKTQNLILNNDNLYTNDLYKVGAINGVLKDGKLETLLKYIKKFEENPNMIINTKKITNRIIPITYIDLKESVNIWAETIVNLPHKYERVIETLIKRQEKKGKTT